MAFILHLTQSEGDKSPVVVVVDELSKRLHFIPLRSHQTALDHAEVFYKESYEHHRLAREIFSDKDTPLTRKLYMEFMKFFRVQFNLSTAFHSQTNKQSERAFWTVQEMMRCFVSRSRRNWPKYDQRLELAYNSHVRESTKHLQVFTVWKKWLCPFLFPYVN